MKLLLHLFVLTGGCVCAQSSLQRIRPDTSRVVQPEEPIVPIQMPVVRPGNAFYRNPSDPRDVIRATLDNMPIKIPDSSTNYTILQPGQRYRRRTGPPLPFLKPMPRILPGRP